MDVSTLPRGLKLLRKQRKLTLDALAQRAGLTKGYLSKVERGLSVPSIAAVMKMASTLGVSVGELLGEANSHESVHVVRAGERRPFERASTKIGYNYEAIAPSRVVKAMEPFVMRPPLTLSRGKHMFTHAGDELFFVLKGKVELKFEDQSVTLGPGDSAYFNGSVRHRSRSLGRIPAEVLIVISNE